MHGSSAEVLGGVLPSLGAGRGIQIHVCAGDACGKHVDLGL